MTFWANLLTLIILVLSIAFAAMSTVIFAKRENFRELYGKERDDKAAIQQRLEGERDAAREERDQKAADLQLARGQIDDQVREIESLKADLDQRRLDGEQLKGEMAALVDTYAKVADNNTVLTNRNSELMADNEIVTKENRDLIAKLGDERTRANDLEKLNADLTTERDGLKVNFASANDTIRMNEEVFAELARNQIEARPIIDKIVTLPDVKGKIASVDEENDLVVLNVGENQGVRKNFNFTVFRGDKFVAKVNVLQIFDNYCAAQVVTRKLPIELGDNAWTRLY